MNKEENDVIIQPKEKRKENAGAALGIAFLVWFIGSFIAIFYCAEYKPDYVVMVFGQYFLVFGLIPLFATTGKEKLIAVPFILVGLGCIVIPYLMMHPELLKVTIIWEAVIPVIFMLVFVGAGLAMVILPILNRRKLEKTCTAFVDATITEYLSYMDEDTTVYCPVYSFEYMNKKYKVDDNFYTNFNIRPEGTVVKLRINPLDPKEFFDPSSKSSNFVVLIGGLFLLVSVPVLVFLLASFQFVK